jgi:hypothetical protein
MDWHHSVDAIAACTSSSSRRNRLPVFYLQHPWLLPTDPLPNLLLLFFLETDSCPSMYPKPFGLAVGNDGESTRKPEESCKRIDSSVSVLKKTFFFFVVEENELLFFPSCEAGIMSRNMGPRNGRRRRATLHREDWADGARAKQ